jgi:hypothetical protein
MTLHYGFPGFNFEALTEIGRPQVILYGHISLQIEEPEDFEDVYMSEVLYTNFHLYSIHG